MAKWKSNKCTELDRISMEAIRFLVLVPGLLYDWSGCSTISSIGGTSPRNRTKGSPCCCPKPGALPTSTDPTHHALQYPAESHDPTFDASGTPNDTPRWPAPILQARPTVNGANLDSTEDRTTGNGVVLSLWGRARLRHDAAIFLLGFFAQYFYRHIQVRILAVVRLM